MKMIFNAIYIKSLAFLLLFLSSCAHDVHASFYVRSYILGSNQSHMVIKENIPFLLAVDIEGSADEAETVPLKIHLSGDLQSKEDGGKNLSAKDTIVRPININKKYSCQMQVFEIIPKKVGLHDIKIQFRDYQDKLTVRVSPNAQLNENNVEITKVQFPVNAEGEVMINRERNKVILKRDQFSSLAKFFGFQDGVADRNPDMYLKIFLRNNTGATFFIKGDIILCDLITGKDVPGLYIVDEENQGTISFSHMASGQKEEQFIIPVYFDKDLVKEGDYELCFRINNLKKYEIQEKLTVIKDQSPEVITILGSVLPGILFILFKRPRIVKRINALSTRCLVLSSLFSVMLFLCTTIPVNFLGDIVKIFTGPFSFIITGLFSSILFYSLLVAAMILMPYFGTVSLILLIRFFIGAVFFGSISASSMLHVFYQIFLMELAAYFYRKMQDKNLYLCGLLICILDIVLFLIDIQVAKLFYRIFYADWYVWFVAFLNSGVYTYAGFLSGIRIGKLMTKVRGD